MRSFYDARLESCVGGRQGKAWCRLLRYFLVSIWARLSVAITSLCDSVRSDFVEAVENLQTRASGSFAFSLTASVKEVVVYFARSRVCEVIKRLTGLCRWHVASLHKSWCAGTSPAHGSFSRKRFVSNLWRIARGFLVGLDTFRRP